ncbi:MAG: hypothetical protein GVY35_15790 [Bacteroidetes bacterium]|nr:hypothetical protein [Bacteroidota bacterium]
MHDKYNANNIFNHTMISARDQIYGAVLRQIVKEGGARLAEVSDCAGRFRLNGSTSLLVKYATNSSSPWYFSFHPEHIKILRRDLNEHGGLFSIVCLVCGSDSICALRHDEWSSVLDLNAQNSQQTITLRRAKRCSFSVSGPVGMLDYKVPASRFPTILTP